MLLSAGEVQGWGGKVPMMSEDALLLAEATHRISNELMAAMATMRRALMPADAQGQSIMVRSAIDRLEGFGEVINILNVVPGSRVDLAPPIERMCRAICAARLGFQGCSLLLDLERAWVKSETARRLMMIASELVHNSLRHALDGRTGTLSVSLRLDERHVELTVADNCAGPQAVRQEPGRGMGGPIVAQLIERAGGRIERKKVSGGMAVRVTLPA